MTTNTDKKLRAEYLLSPKKPNNSKADNKNDKCVIETLYNTFNLM